MSCQFAESTVHGYFDGELDAVRSAEFERHLESCAECQAALSGIESLHKRLQQSELNYRASTQLRDRVTDRFAADPAGRVRARDIRRWLSIPAFAALVIAIVGGVMLIQGRGHHDQLAAELIDAHVRALQPGHLTDVLSTDQHTVKPWFDGKLDFIPPVSDFTNDGFPLVGGRLDVMDGHNIAALVYSRRKHLISVFVWPYLDRGPSADGAGSRNGYNWVMWQSGDMRFCLVSDVSSGDLNVLKKLIHSKEQ